MKTLTYYTLTGLCLLLVTGCGSSNVQVPINYEHGKFDLTRTDIDLSKVEVALAYGDRYRNTVHELLYPAHAPSPPPNLYVIEMYTTEAKKFYRHVLENLEPNNAYAQLNIGYLSLMQVRSAQGKDRARLLSAANANFSEAEKHRPGYKDAYIYIGEYHAMQDNFDKALDRFEALLDAKIETAYIHSWAGYCNLRLGRKPQAEEHFRKAVDRGDPEQSATYAREQY